MKILIANKGIIPVRLYGGTERVVWSLGKELFKLGHDVTYLVSKGSSCDFAKVIYIDEQKEISEQIPDTVDIIHFNFTPKDIEKVNKPYVITMHHNINAQIELNSNTIFVSKNHADRYRSNSFVYNGLDWGDYTKPSFPVHRNYFHFLGDAAWRVKNVKGAIDVIKKTKAEKIKILGGVRFNINKGLRFTFTSRAHFCGMVGGKQKDKLLQHSKGLIFPVKWNEPFGLAIIESLYFGCPVFGTPYGSLPEIVVPDVGFLSNKREAITYELENIEKYSNKYCHEYAVEKFSARKMALSYINKYETIMSGEKLNVTPPKLKALQKNKFLKWIK